MRLAALCILMAGCASPPLIADCDETVCHYKANKKRVNMICYGFYGQIGDGGCFIIQDRSNILITPVDN